MTSSCTLIIHEVDEVDPRFHYEFECLKSTSFVEDLRRYNEESEEISHKNILTYNYSDCRLIGGHKCAIYWQGNLCLTATGQVTAIHDEF